MLDGFNFSTELAVRFSETDAQGVAHNAAYLVWYEVARIDYLARYAHGYRHIQGQGLEALTIESHVRYLKPVFFDDRLTIHARCRDIRGARFRFEYVVMRLTGSSSAAGEGSALLAEPVADGWTSHAVVDAKTLRPTRFPAWLREAIDLAEL